MWNKRRRGIALVVTLVMAAIIAASAMYLHSSVSLETQIATNTRRIMQAKTASISGMNHFQAMNIFYEQIQNQASGNRSERIEVIPETTLGDKTFYKVEVDLCCELGDREFMVISTGYYKKADRVISTHVSRSLFKTID
tara:strand:- start:5323 stop:5739 length:417 start_codon:yes stop_codon:yes gene_type:complete